MTVMPKYRAGFLLVIMLAVAAATGPVDEIIIHGCAVLVLAIFLTLHARILLGCLEDDLPFRRFIFGAILLLLALFVAVPHTSQWSFIAAGLRLLLAFFFLLAVLLLVRLQPSVGEWLVRGGVAAAALLAIAGILTQALTGEPRLTVNWANPALIGAILTPAFAHLVCRPGGWSWRRWLLVLVLAAALLLTLSRGVIAALILALPALWWWERPADNRRRLITGGLLLLLAAHAVLGMDRWRTGNDPQSFGRLDIWRATGEIIVQHPLRGVGWDALGEVMQAHKIASVRDPFRWGQFAQQAHNEYLNTAAECGLPALGLLLYLLAVLLRIAARATAAPAGLRWALAAWLLHAGVDNLAHFTPTLLVPALLLGLILPAAWPPLVQPVRPRSATTLALSALLMLLVCIGPLLIGRFFFFAGYTAEQRRDDETALDYYTTAAAWSPLTGLYHMHRGGILLRRLKTATLPPEQFVQVQADAANAIAHAVILEPRNPQFIAQQARLQLLSGQGWPAEETLRRALAVEPTNVLHRR
ncbi:MAG TPA: O-antigen ligase family protein, partial [bacterium]|nr:O-antigen ligase family protein [bacterium]